MRLQQNQDRAPSLFRVHVVEAQLCIQRPAAKPQHARRGRAVVVAQFQRGLDNPALDADNVLTNQVSKRMADW